MSLLVAVGGVALAIGLSLLIGAILPFEIDSLTNSQVASRVSPTLVDLMIALAAGGAGAFALSRPDVSDSLPGVAVAIALVPPLAVVGLMLEAGEIENAMGALLLFVTNLVAILAVGALVFVVTGVVPVQRILQTHQRVLYSGALVGTLLMILVVVLGVSSERIRSDAFDVDDAERAVQEWVGDEAFTVFAVDVSGNDAEIVVVGPEAPANPEELAASLETKLGRNLDVTVRWVPEEQYVISGRAD